MIVMVGRDVAPSSAFQLVAEKLSDEEVKLYIGSGKPINATEEEIVKTVSEANALLCGMSSSPVLVKEEIAAIEAASQTGVKVVLYADTFGAVKRMWFKDVREKVNAILVISQKEASDAKSLFPNAEIVMSGNPMVEQSFFPKTSRDEIRAKLGMNAEEKMILSSGYKFPAITLPTMLAIVDAAAMLKHLKFCVVFSLHPGDEAWRSNKHIYDDILGYFLNCREVSDLDNLRIKIMCRDAEEESNRIPTGDILPGADLVVTTLSTIDQEAACLRIPVIEYFTAISLDRMEKNFGTREWEPCKMGIAEGIHFSAEKLALAIERLLVPVNQQKLRAFQEMHYPKPAEKGEALQVITKTILRYARKN